MTGVVYLAGPIDQTNRETIEARRLSLTRWVKAYGMIGYRPWDAWAVGVNAAPDKRVERVNRAALELADALIALVPAGVPTVGTAMEVEAACTRGIPVAVVTDIQGSFSLMRQGIHLVTTEEEAAAYIAKGVNQVRSESPVVLLPNGNDLLVTRDPDLAEDMPEFLPSRAYPDDAGLDLYVGEEVTVPVGATAKVPTGIRAQLPGWAWGFIVSRSSTLVKRKLMVQPAVIDTGWRGPLYVYVTNIGTEPHVVRPGERLAQLIIMDNATRHVGVKEVSELAPHDRGHNGFGSSGS